MTERSPARLLAPVALVVAALALFVVVSSGTGESTDEPASATPAPTATQAPERRRDRGDDTETAASGETYTVEPGDNPSIIAEKAGVELDELLAANPGLDARALSVGEEIQLP